ncbi:hypothetical protein AB1Y20_010124 [Prymnesium parvum]|uniref:DNA-directed RNA polymerase subunit n=1 Tax=Prymnesium parvum TaxID=97485 RepID=A0AB34K452_PRYPA
MHFCPPCGNILHLERYGSQLRFFCQTCPYVYQLKETVYSEVRLDHQDVDDVLGGPEAWKNIDQITEATCSKCNNNRAFYQHLQVRSTADPMSTFYKCTSCGFRWREDGEDDE